MHRIYFEKRVIEICSIKDRSTLDPNAIIFYPKNYSDLSEVIGIFEKNNNIQKICITSDDPENTYKQFCSNFEQINAGGGLVSNKRGDYLFIFRNNFWDLPKGKQEPGEDIRSSALREVEEECGIEDVDIRELLCITDHTYRLGEKFILKHTYWYNMNYSVDIDPTPQTEEDISKAVWICKSSISKYIQQIYPSIIDVLKRGRVI